MIPVDKLACVILAGGKSSRMERDKTLLPFKGHPTLCEYQYRRMNHLFSHVYISTKENEKFGFEADFILDEAEDFAPTYALKRILESVAEPYVFVMAVDMPFLSETTINRLAEAFDPAYDAVIAREDHTVHTLCGIYSKSMLPLFEAAVKADKHKLQLLLQEADTHYVTVDDPRSFVNLNYPHEYEEALTL
jgi:molybdopterin-guanine dinucleotide biosynthesis protein A